MVGRRERAGSARRAAKRWFVRTAADSRAAAPPWPPVGRYCGGQRGGVVCFSMGRGRTLCAASPMVMMRP